MSAIKIDVYDDAGQLAQGVANRVLTIVAEAIDERGSCSIALAGGSTPKRLYELLATDEFREGIDWSRVHLFLGDERYVPLEHPDSNFQMAKEALIDQVSIPDSNVNPVPTELEATAAAAQYEDVIRTMIPAGDDRIPVIDLVLLGIGDDGHTASLFPGTDALRVKDRLVVANDVPQQSATRITFTIPLIQAARETILLATGAGKADAVAKAIEGAPNIEQTPSQILRDARGTVTFALDHDAAGKLSG